MEADDTEMKTNVMGKKIKQSDSKSFVKRVREIAPERKNFCAGFIYNNLPP